MTTITRTGPSYNNKDQNHTGKRYIVGEIVKENNSYTLNYFDNINFSEDAKEQYSGFVAFDMNTKKSYDNGVMELFQKRLPPKQRQDYSDYLRSNRINENLKNNLDSFTLIGLTGGQIEGDGFSFQPVIDVNNNNFQVFFNIAGFRHHSNYPNDINLLRDKQVTLHAEKYNQHDAHAIKIMYKDYNLGYVPYGYNKEIHKFLDRIDFAIISKINGIFTRPNIGLVVSIT